MLPEPEDRTLKREKSPLRVTSPEPALLRERLSLVKAVCPITLPDPPTSTELRTGRETNAVIPSFEEKLQHPVDHLGGDQR